jgi:hypothetical protein
VSEHASVFEDRYVLNHCHKYLARDHGQPSEAWRFPIVDSLRDPDSLDDPHRFNRVTFVWDGRPDPKASVHVLGSFSNDGHSLALRRVLFEGEDTGFRAGTAVVPIGQVHRYRFLIDGAPTLDPINPQRTQEDNGTALSRFFTWYCARPLVLERHERALLKRLTDHILPFRSGSAENFLRRYYYSLDKEAKTREIPQAFRLDESVGVVSFIDCLLAREENHRLVDYRICLAQIARILRARYPGVNVSIIPREKIVELYEEMASESIAGWDHSVYQSPAFFLKLLRRHAITGAFCHPKYGGNGGAAAWSYLADRYVDQSGNTLFDWQRSIEKPWGTSPDYRG